MSQVLVSLGVVGEIIYHTLSLLKAYFGHAYFGHAHSNIYDDKL